MTTIVTIDMGGTGATHAAGAREALSVPSMTDMGNAYAQANAAYAQANSAFNGANNARVTVFANNGSANVTTQNINFLNTSTILVTVANTSGNGDVTFSLNGTPYDQANTARNTANDAYSQANAAYDQANGAYGQANTARSDANTTFGTINSTFGTINTNYQAAYAQANVARTTANDAYATANTKLGTSGGSISGDLTISGNLTVQGNATTINVSNLSVNDSIILLSANSSGDAEDIGFIGHITRDSTNTHVGLIRKATENRFYLFDNYEVEPTNNTIDITGNNFRVGNIRLGTINANSFVTAAGLDVTGQANAAYGQANTARSDANTTFATINTTFGTINTSFGTINTSYQAAYAQANTARTTANDAYGQANAAYGAANNRVLKAGDTMTGALIINPSTGGSNVIRVGVASQEQFYIEAGITSITNSALLVKQDNGYNYLTLRANNVGIGTTNPGYKLDVVGGVRTTTACNLGNAVTQGGPTSTNVTANATLLLSGVGGNYLAFGQYGASETYAQWIQSSYENPTTAVYNLVLQPLGGNVGINTTSPGTKLEVVGTISYKPATGTSLTLSDDTSYGTSGTGRYTTLGFSGTNNGANRIFAHNNGEDGIFICAATNRAVVIRAGGSGTDHSVFTSAGNFYTNGYITNIRGNASVSAPSTSDHSLGTRIALYDQSATSWYAIGIESDTMWFNSDNQYKWYADASQTMILNSSGNLTIAGTLTENSSETIKENIDPITNALDIVSQLSGVTYDRKDGSAKKRAGLIAEQVDKVLPNVVQKDEQGNPSGVQYTNLIAYLVESIKELKTEIDNLKKQNGSTD